jgi:hypothetical protein
MYLRVPLHLYRGTCEMSIPYIAVRRPCQNFGFLAFDALWIKSLPLKSDCYWQLNPRTGSKMKKGMKSCVKPLYKIHSVIGVLIWIMYKVQALIPTFFMASYVVPIFGMFESTLCFVLHFHWFIIKPAVDALPLHLERSSDYCNGWPRRAVTNYKHSARPIVHS